MIQIRVLEPSEWRLFREFRLAALQAAPGVFGSSYEREEPMPQERWTSLLDTPTGAVFGLFDDERLIGITSVYTDRDDPLGQTAGLAMSFILPEYRGRGLSEMFYEARLAWVRARPQFRRVVVGHRASNEASRRANQKHGFQLFLRRPHLWPDGVTEDELLYELPLS
jgi:RimJ/RimL family protein N-acetyltransferase